MNAPESSSSSLPAPEQNGGPAAPERSEGVPAPDANTTNPSSIIHHPSSDPPPPAPAPGQIENQKAKSKNRRTRVGTVARLPKSVRDRIDQMLDDGFKHTRILQELGPDAKGLKPDHIRSWKHGGYQDHLRFLEHLDECRARTDRAFLLLRDTGRVQGFQGIQQLAASQVAEALAAGSEILRHALQANPLNYFRMLNAFARLTTGGLKCERLLDQQAERAAQRQPAFKKGLTPETLKELNEKLHLM